MNNRLPSPFPDMEDTGYSQHSGHAKSAVPGFVFLSQPQADSMRPSSSYYKAPRARAASRGLQYSDQHSPRFGNGYRGGYRSPYHDPRGKGGQGNNSSYGHLHQGNLDRGNNSSFLPRGNNMSPSNYSSPRPNMAFNNYNSPRSNMSPSNNNSPRGNMSSNSFNSPRGDGSFISCSSPGGGKFQSGPNFSPSLPSSSGSSSPFSSPSTPNSYQNSPFMGAGSGQGNRGRRGHSAAPLSDVPADKFMSAGILQNPWDRFIKSLDRAEKEIYLLEEEHCDAGRVDSPCGDASSSRIEESNEMFVDSWQ